MDALDGTSAEQEVIGGTSCKLAPAKGTDETSATGGSSVLYFMLLNFYSLYELLKSSILFQD